ncbi:hypothetical protein ABZS66_12165 [Dactylosporangium sp. NPDC005572]|uniref:hypothetical protein n=1 Tax=Dactylosporangium sp. NPDC005572 TaxID=3156889 RepID=UPI0033A5ADB2
MTAAPASVMVVPGGPAWARMAAESLTDVLAVHPVVAGWLAPDRAVYPLIDDLALVIQRVVDAGGEALMLDDRGGVLAWSSTPARLPRVAATRRVVVDDGYAARWALLEEALHSTVPVGTPDQLLILLAAAGTGLASARRAVALLTTYHRTLDAAAAAVHTAAFDPALVRLLHSCGWTPEPQRTLPDGLPWWPVHRQPRPTPRRHRSTMLTGQAGQAGTANSEPVQ